MDTNLMDGTTVYASDGEELGTVKEIRGDYFKIDAPMSKDYWLRCDAVVQTPEGRACAAFTHDRLDANKQPEPATV